MNAQGGTGTRAGGRLRIGAVGAAIAVAATLLTGLPALDPLHGLDTDALHWLRARIAPVAHDPADSPVAVVAIDEATYRAQPFAGLPKVMWTPQIARVQNAVLGGGARVFAWDLVLPTSANTYVADKRYDKPLLVSLLRHGRQAGRVVLGALKLGQTPIEPYPAFARAVGGPTNVRALNAYADPDGIVRGVPLYLRAERDGEARRRPGMALEVASRYLGAAPRFPGPRTMQLGDRAIPHDGAGNMIAGFSGKPGAIPTYSFRDLHACAEAGNTDYFARHFEGRAVLLGLVLDLEDRILAGNRFITRPDFAAAPAPCTGKPPIRGATARDATPGVYVHATAVDNMIRGGAIRRPGTAERLAIALALAGLAVAAALYLRPGRATLALVAGAAAYALGAAFLFRAGREIPLLDPGAGAVLAFSGALAFRFVWADREQRRVRRTFAHYLDPQVIESMLARGDVPELGGESRELTCFFSDIAGFSGISERMTPAELVEFLNRYFGIVGRAIEAEGGIIERFLGDAVCAVFGAPVSDPDHAAKAVRTALAIDRALAEAAEAGTVTTPDGGPVETRIGLNTGTMTVGNVGAERRYAYTVMGDAVNLAARLESGAKQFGVRLLAGEDTVAAAGAGFLWREIDRVRVVGRDAPVTLYEPLGEADAVSDAVRTRKDRYEAALARLRAGEVDAAVAAFEALAADGDPAAAKTAERARTLRAHILAGDWDGVTALTSK